MYLFPVLAALFACASAVSAKKRIHGENGWYIPQINKTLKWVDLVECEPRCPPDVDLNPVDFYLYTKSNPREAKKIEMKRSSIKNSPFRKWRDTYFIIHGWLGRYTNPMNIAITKAWLERGDCNVIVVDWARARFPDYISSVLAIPGAGARVGEMIKHLNKSHGLSFDNVEVIGHSLGAHVAGFTGKTVGERRIRAIIGLDPALPLFRYDRPHKRLNSDDAWYVESIQTNGGELGFLKPIGKAAFYPNGGVKQPGCPEDFFGMCSHERSHIYYEEAVRLDNFGSKRCDTYRDAVDEECGYRFSNVRMGNKVNLYNARGYFYVPVNDKRPFGIVPRKRFYKSPS